MIAALLIGREGSEGFPGKNLLNVLGRPLCEYPILAAQAAASVGPIYVSTDSESIKEIGKRCGCRIIERPPELASKEALGEDAYVHGYHLIRTELEKQGEELELIVLLMCNAPTINGNLIEEGIAKLRSDPQADSAVTVSIYNMWSPIRARRLNAKGFLESFAPLSLVEDLDTVNSERDSESNVYFADMGVSIVRPHCLDSMEEGILPQKWMGRKILPIHNWGGLDMDYASQIGMVEFWLREHGIRYKGMAEEN